ncbi:glutathione S-transferase family protein [Silanimonas algicola]
MLELVIGNKNYSSWSLRPWLLLRHFDVPFHEVRLPLDTPEFRRRIPDYSPTGRVPVLHDGARVVWDSLAICEYVNEAFLDGRGWPADPALRCLARCAASEMHSGFAALRAQLPMNCRRTPNAYRWNADADADIRRVLTLWRELRRRADGPFLLGRFGIVDAMFAPVAIRFRGYGVALDDNARHYCDALFALPAMREWQTAAEAESERLAYDAL